MNKRWHLVAGSRIIEKSPCVAPRSIPQVGDSVSVPTTAKAPALAQVIWAGGYLFVPVVLLLLADLVPGSGLYSRPAAAGSAGVGAKVDATWRVFVPIVVGGSGTGPSDWWRPPVNTTWQWQLTDPIDQSFDVVMYDIDMFENKASTVAALHAKGRKVICYISVGSWEDWRPDAEQFPSVVLGKNYGGWPGEKWLDIRRIDLLAPIMRARLDECQAKGFDGVEPDNMDGYTNNTGFPLTYEDQLAYNLWLAEEAHARGLSIGLKNDDEQVTDLLDAFDWALTEDCFAQDWCDEMEPFIAAGKAVFAAEYSDEMTRNQFLSNVCPQASAMQFSAIFKDRDLDAFRVGCP